jgi:FAD binding domain
MLATPRDPDWAEETAGFNLAWSPTPMLVVGATSTADVAIAVRYAADTGRRVAVQAPGHGLMADLDGTVLVTTRRMTGVEIDPVARTARVEAGVRWRAVIDAAAPRGLAPLNGSSSQVGVVGYTTGGGLGPMARRYGFAADHVTAFRIVTADGAVRDVRADSTDPDDIDLFWAVRGGKSSFGIVTEMTFELVCVAGFHARRDLLRGRRRRDGPAHLAEVGAHASRGHNDFRRAAAAASGPEPAGATAGAVRRFRTVRPPRVPNAVAGRDAAFSAFTVGVLAGAPVEVVAAGGAEVVDTLSPWARGGLLNFLGQAGPDRVGQLWDPADRARLLAIRERFDPAELFATNVVIGRQDFTR